MTDTTKNPDHAKAPSLRDYFAAKALPGLMGRNWAFHKGTDEELIALWVQTAYFVADTMLAAREKAAQHAHTADTREV